MVYKLGLLLILMVIASVYDVKKKKIPNFIFYIGMITFILFDYFIYPASSSTILSKLLFILFLFFFGSFRLLGMGDIKLWMVITGYLGIIHSCIIIAISSVLLIIFSVFCDKENYKIVFLTVNQIINKEKIQIVNQKSYPFAPFMFISTLVICVMKIYNIIS